MKHVNGKAHCQWHYLSNWKNKISKHMLLLENTNYQTIKHIHKIKFSIIYCFWPIHHYFIFFLTPRELLYTRTVFLFQKQLDKSKNNFQNPTRNLTLHSKHLFYHLHCVKWYLFYPSSHQLLLRNVSRVPNPISGSTRRLGIYTSIIPINSISCYTNMPKQSLAKMWKSHNQ